MAGECVAKMTCVLNSVSFRNALQNPPERMLTICVEGTLWNFVINYHYLLLLNINCQQRKHKTCQLLVPTPLTCNGARLAKSIA